MVPQALARLGDARAQRQDRPARQDRDPHKTLGACRKFIGTAPPANPALKDLLGKVDMHPKDKGRAVTCTARCNLKLGEVSPVFSHGSGDSNQPVLNLDAALALNLDLPGRAQEPMDADLSLSEG
jgi:hypothetical protein